MNPAYLPSKRRRSVNDDPRSLQIASTVRVPLEPVRERQLHQIEAVVGRGNATAGVVGVTRADASALRRLQANAQVIGELKRPAEVLVRQAWIGECHSWLRTSGKRPGAGQGSGTRGPTRRRLGSRQCCRR